jgi:hypothetical protein
VADGSVPTSEWPRVRAFAERLLSRNGEAPTHEVDARRLLALIALAK